MGLFRIVPNSTAAVTFPRGFIAGGTICGLKVSGKTDLGILQSQGEAFCLGAFTRNAFAAAPVLVSRNRLNLSSRVRAVVVNSGNANACTGEEGLVNANAMADLTAQGLNIPSSEVVVCSTGVIGVPLNIAKVQAGVQNLIPNLHSNGGDQFAAAIMTTDTRDKQVTVEIETSKGLVRIGGCSKGAGMIHPDMATMLAFVTTDIKLNDAYKSEFLQIVDDSFNSITVDGDTSTNDTVLLMASGASGLSIDDLELSERQAFGEALFYVFAELAKLIIRDGEGATKFVHLTIEGAADRDTARTYARYIANSKLVKTAMFGQDPNWGRLIASLGNIARDLDPLKVSLRFDDEVIVRGGQPVPVDRSLLSAIVSKSEYEVVISLGQGFGKSTVWTCDLSYEYVKINAEYTT